MEFNGRSLFAAGTFSGASAPSCIDKTAECAAWLTEHEGTEKEYLLTITAAGNYKVNSVNSDWLCVVYNVGGASTQHEIMNITADNRNEWVYIGTTLVAELSIVVAADGVNIGLPKYQVGGVNVGDGGNADMLDGKHARDFAEKDHKHSFNDLADKPTIPTSLPANGGNADTVGGKTVEQIVAEATGNMPTSGGETAYALVSNLAELQAALAAGAKHIHLAVGADITVNANLTLPAGITLIGNGACLRRATGFEGVILNLGENCRVQDLTIYGNRTAMVSPTWSRTVEISTKKNCVVDNVSVVNGNEAIMVYGDDCIVMNCNITNCGGNGIHFSGANRVRVENCTIIGANKRSGMGHEDGCIVWSNECQDIVCTNNYCEDGKYGFGSIDSPDNSNVKIIGNTVKNCEGAIDLICPANSAKNIIISGNHFINSGRIYVNATENRNPPLLHGTIADNILESTAILIINFSGAAITGNIIQDGFITLQFCTNISVFGNVIDNISSADIPLYLYGSKSITIDGNRIRGWNCLIDLSTTAGIVITNNDIRHNHLGTKDGAAIRNNDHCKNLLFCNNRVTVYEKQAMIVYSYNTVSNNIFIINDSSLRCLDAKNANENTLAIGNRVVGTVSSNLVSDGTTRRGAYNDLPAYDDVFVGCTMNLANCTSNAPAKITLGDSFTCTLTANSGYSLPASISGTNNGVALTANDYEFDPETGILTVYAVMGALAITAAG